MLKTTKSKFVFYTIFFIAIFSGLPMIFLLGQFTNNFEERSKILLEASLDVLEFGINNCMMQSETKNVQKTIDNISLSDNIDHVRLFKKDGTIKYSSDKSENQKNIFQIAPDHFDSIYIEKNERVITLTDNLHAYTAFQPIRNKPECQNCHGEEDVIAYLDIDTHITESEKYFITGRNHTVMLGVITIFLLGIGFYYSFNHFISKPLNLFEKALDKVEEGDLSTRLVIEKDDEFGELNKHFNRMVEEIQTSREKIEEMHFNHLQHADKLATIGELTSSIAHEINNYSAILLTRTDFLRLEAENNILPNRYKNDLDVIEGYVEKITKITKNILRHSKKMNKDFITFDLRKIVSQSSQILEPILAKRNIEFNNQLPEIETTIFGDPIQIEQILTNLTYNAVDAISSNGSITIKVKQTDSDSVILEIEDNGSGIDETSLKNIFAPFYSTKSEGKGTGLGLYIVKNICKNHKAKISVKSKLNEGTTFTIVFNNKEIS